MTHVIVDKFLSALELHKQTTDNYIPFTVVREVLANIGIEARDSQDAFMFALVKENLVEMSTMLNAGDLTDEELDAGIPASEISGDYFYLSINELQDSTPEPLTTTDSEVYDSYIQTNEGKQMQVTSTVKELQAQTDRLIKEQQKLIDQNLMLKEDSNKYKSNVTRYEEIERELEALDEAKAKAMSKVESRFIGKDSKGFNQYIIGTPEPAKPLVAVAPKQSIQSTAKIAQPHVNQPTVGESLPTPEVPKFKALDALEIKRQQLEIKREELLKQLDQVNSELATVKEEMSAEITKVRESEAPKSQPEPTKEQVPTKVVPKFPKLEAATNRKELTEAVKFYRDNGKYFVNISLNKDTATILSQLNKSLEGMNATERLTINQLVPAKTTKVAKTTKTTEVDKKTTDNSITRKEMIAALKSLATKPTEVKLNAKTEAIAEWYAKYCK